MLAGMGASSAASEILLLVEEIKRKYADNPDVLEDLGRIERKAQEIKEAGDTGWY